MKLYTAKLAPVPGTPRPNLLMGMLVCIYREPRCGIMINGLARQDLVSEGPSADELGRGLGPNELGPGVVT